MTQYDYFSRIFLDFYFEVFQTIFTLNQYVWHYIPIAVFRLSDTGNYLFYTAI